MTKIIFMGTPDFSVPILNRLIRDQYDVIAVVTQPDRPVGRKKTLTPPPVKVEALKHGLPVIQPEKIREEDQAQLIIDLKADLIVTAAYGQIVPTSILNAPKYGCINVHASLLPELRGGAPIHYAIMEGKEKTGITIMYMTEKLDAGDMLSQVAVTIENDDNVGTMHDKLSVAGAELLSETIPNLLTGNIQPIPQNDDEATFARNITRDQEKINWDRPGKRIYDQIRGLCPWPVAYTLFDGTIYKIWKAEIKRLSTSSQKEPGTIIHIDKEGFIVSTGDHEAIKVVELQPAGKKKMPAEQFLLGGGSTLKINDRFDT